MKATESTAEERRLRIVRDAESLEMSTNDELPAFQTIPDSAPLVAVKAGTVSMILPWCC